MIGLTNKQRAKLELNLYGLSGSGLQFKNNFVKIMARIERHKDIEENHLIPACKNLKMGQPINIRYVQKTKNV